ncbi:hypothetical protein E1B28_008187 [Marasmius oreades]|uniref:Uncharacterized protein n=1 Tax=Marasmius oreades TaxID=181124 RepID=A0A9P7RY07_9AGAR|nr:uncharacterized protein E1B28_008187 [Marasmius oreades]KAG7091782.1 hypothetical protein E1B28_008187 [Marasmius oreades]
MFFSKSLFVAILTVASASASVVVRRDDTPEKIGDYITACKHHKVNDKCHYLWLDGDVVREFNGYCLDYEGVLECITVNTGGN